MSFVSFAFFFPAPCDADAFFCHSNMCINNTLVCNGMQNCVYPWDENQCKGELSGVGDWLESTPNCISMSFTCYCTCSSVTGCA